MQYREEYDGSFLAKLDRGEEVIESLKNLARKLGWRSATFTGIGALDRLDVGYFDVKEKEYLRGRLEDSHELLSLKGNIAIGPDDELVIHAHVVLGDRDMHVYGGHLFKGYVSVTAEIRIWPMDDVRREPDEETTLNLWNL